MDWSAIAKRTDDQAEALEDLAHLWRPLLIKAAASAIARAFAGLLTWPGWESRFFPHFELSDRALHDIGLNRLDAGHGAIRLLRR